MTVLVDTSVWSTALRRDRTAPTRELEALHAAIESGGVCLLGVILQEVLQGFPSLERTRRLVERLAPPLSAALRLIRSVLSQPSLE